MSQIRPVDENHRKGFKSYCVNDSDPMLRPWIEMLYQAWSDYNLNFFSNAMLPPYIMIGDVGSTAAYGEFSPISDFGGKGQLTIKDTLMEGRHAHFQGATHIDPQKRSLGQLRFILDELLHLMVHQYCIEVLDKPETHSAGHGTVFAAECTRIGSMMQPSLPPVGEARNTRRAQASARLGIPLLSCADWPHNVRPSDYYLGAYEPNGVHSVATTPMAPAAVTPTPKQGPDVSQLLADIADLKKRIKVVEGERDQARADLQQMVANVPVPNAAVEQVLFDILTVYGVQADDHLKLGGYLSDLARDYPMERRLLVLAASIGVEDLVSSVAMAPIRAGRLRSLLVDQHGIAPSLAKWVTDTWLTVLQQRNLAAVNATAATA